MKNLSKTFIKLTSFTLILLTELLLNITYATAQTTIGNNHQVKIPKLSPKNNFKLKVGDLLFQDLNCGILCQGINQVTYGIGNTNISHVAMVVTSNTNQVMVIEAIGNSVHKTTLSQFLQRSLDNKHNPRVIVERLKPQYQWEIPAAIKFSLQQIGKPYNSSFTPNGYKSFYCSDLIYKAFATANPKAPLFRLYPMNFTDGKTHKITPQWASYFNQIHSPIPQGKLGTNPGIMSRNQALILVHRYGTLTPATIQ